MSCNTDPMEHRADPARDAALPDRILTQWFGQARPDNDSALQHKLQWFTKSPAFDAQLRQRFGAAVQAALDGRLRHWAAQGAWQRLALVLLLDQFSRNIFRNTPQSFAGDAQALSLALEARELGADLELPEVARTFLYLPLEHAEDPAMQERSVAVFETLLQTAPDAATRDYLAGSLDYARRHREVIERFGRFPHRNAILGRRSTAAELAYLAQPGSGF
ncbi:DUF924 family protein [Comamonas guangdongensis]|uniref:DUF924 family protein n=1 Tax=Comamonas guangdongensis TaxID=510515 RepID=A0ABV3ZUC7_9BURK